MSTRSGPQRSALGNPEASTSPTVHLSAGDQPSGGPSGVWAQSNSRTRRAISLSPSPARGANGELSGAAVPAAADTTIGGEDDGGFSTGSIRPYNELARLWCCHRPAPGVLC